MVVRVIGGLAIAAGAVGVGFLVAMRAKYAPVQKAVRRMNRAVWNPQALRDAGSPGASASIIRHRGRTSGKAFETPVVAYVVDGAILVALPYGTNTDWYKNLRAAGGGEVVHEGVAYAVDAPEVVSLDEVRGTIPAGQQRTFRVFKVDQVLRLPVRSEVPASS